MKPKVAIFIDDDQSYPPLGCGVYVSGPPEDTAGFSTWLGRACCFEVKTPEEADIVFFTGGPDVSPSLYGEDKMVGTHTDSARDADDVALYKTCEELGIPMVGICRGMQFLWVMQGGKLYQHLDGHYTGEHEIHYMPTNEVYTASSVHHQAIRPSSVGSGVRFLALASESTLRKYAGLEDHSKLADFEMFVMEEKAIIGIQGHPEYPGFPNFSRLCIEVIDKFIMQSSSTAMVGGKVRLASVLPAKVEETIEVINSKGE